MSGIGYEPTRLILPARLSFERWLDVCRGLGGMARGHQWWIGDALNEGERRFGEEWSQGEAEIGVEPQTQSNWKWVAAAFTDEKTGKPSRRREDLSWSHHAEAARLGPDAQEEMLAEAAENGLTVRQLRDAIALKYPQSGDPPLAHEPLSERENEAVQKRLERISLALDRWREEQGALADYVDGEDVAWLVQLARRLTRGAQ